MLKPQDMSREKRYLLALIGLSVMSATYQSVVFWLGVYVSGRLVSLCACCCLFLLVLWIDADSKARANVYRPHDFGQLVLFFWLPYLPFYLWRTRRLTGLIMFVGLLGLLLLGDLATLAIEWMR